MPDERDINCLKRTLADLDLSSQGTTISSFGVPRVDPGFIYILESEGYVKIGRTRNPRQRLKPARTWNPHLTVIGIKPFWQHTAAEHTIHLDMARAWKKLEWFKMPDAGYADTLEEFREFDDLNLDHNSIDFIYWMNGSGMSEFVQEFEETQLSKQQFLSSLS